MSTAEEIEQVLNSFNWKNVVEKVDWSGWEHSAIPNRRIILWASGAWRLQDRNGKKLASSDGNTPLDVLLKRLVNSKGIKEGVDLNEEVALGVKLQTYHNDEREGQEIFGNDYVGPGWYDMPGTYYGHRAEEEKRDLERAGYKVRIVPAKEVKEGVEDRLASLAILRGGTGFGWGYDRKPYSLKEVHNTLDIHRLPLDTQRELSFLPIEPVMTPPQTIFKTLKTYLENKDIIIFCVGITITIW